jgi:hypothetical protein
LPAIGLAHRRGGGENQPQHNRYNDRISHSIPKISENGIPALPFQYIQGDPYLYTFSFVDLPDEKIDLAAGNAYLVEHFQSPCDRAFAGQLIFTVRIEVQVQNPILPTLLLPGACFSLL